SDTRQSPDTRQSGPPGLWRGPARSVAGPDVWRSFHSKFSPPSAPGYSCTFPRDNPGSNTDELGSATCRHPGGGRPSTHPAGRVAGPVETRGPADVLDSGFRRYDALFDSFALVARGCNELTESISDEPQRGLTFEFFHKVPVAADNS